MGKEKAHVTKNQMWNIATSKFYSEIMGKLTSFFGFDPETVTEAEIDGALQNVQNIAQIKADALVEAQKGIDAKFADITERLSNAESMIETLNAQKAEADSKIAEAVQNAENLTAAIAEKENANADLQKKITTLAGEVSTLKAGRVTEKNEGEGGEQFKQKVTPSGAIVIEAAEMDARFGFKAN